MLWYAWVIIGIIVILFLSGIRIIRPVEKGLVERLGKYKRYSDQGFHWIIPIIERMITINTTERMIDAKKQEIITKDRLNATVDAQIYFKVKPDEENVKNSQYNVYDYEYQIVNLSRTTLRNIIGTLPYDKANSDRDSINGALQKILKNEAAPWGIEIVRTELKEIDPPKDVQASMNMVIKAENEKQAAIDMATATETKADGERRAVIKVANGEKQATILKAEGQAEAIKKVADAEAQRIKVVNEAAEKYFVGNAQTLKKLEVTQASLEKSSKFIVDTEKGISTVITDVANVTPIPIKK